MEKTREQVNSHGENASLCHKRILLVDDNAELLSLNKSVLELKNYDVVTAQSGQEALRILANGPSPDLILLDVRMDDMSGPEFLLELENQQPEILEKVPAVFLTALDQVPASKAAGFIRKPYEFDSFFASIHKFIEKRNA